MSGKHNPTMTGKLRPAIDKRVGSICYRKSPPSTLDRPDFAVTNFAENGEQEKQEDPSVSVRAIVRQNRLRCIGGSGCFCGGLARTPGLNQGTEAGTYFQGREAWCQWERGIADRAVRTGGICRESR